MKMVVGPTYDIGRGDTKIIINYSSFTFTDFGGLGKCCGEHIFSPPLFIGGVETKGLVNGIHFCHSGFSVSSTPQFIRCITMWRCGA